MGQNVIELIFKPFVMNTAPHIQHGLVAEEHDLPQQQRGADVFDDNRRQHYGDVLRSGHIVLSARAIREAYLDGEQDAA
jgi:hypothetical protein